MTSPNRGRIARGRKTQRILAEWYVQQGWDYAEAVYGSMPGRDITGMPGVCCEVKATRSVPLLSALRQVTRNTKGEYPYVVWRPDGYGPERVGEWVAAMTVEMHTQLLREAGYGGKDAPWTT